MHDQGRSDDRPFFGPCERDGVCLCFCGDLAQRLRIANAEERLVEQAFALLSAAPPTARHSGARIVPPILLSDFCSGPPLAQLIVKKPDSFMVRRAHNERNRPTHWRHKRKLPIVYAFPESGLAQVMAVRSCNEPACRSDRCCRSRRRGPCPCCLRNKRARFPRASCRPASS